MTYVKEKNYDLHHKFFPDCDEVFDEIFHHNVIGQ